MENTKRMEALIKKLNAIYKKGYMPSREKEDYSELYAKSVNCFGHACFNLLNKDLEKLNSYLPELKYFFRHSSGFGNSGYFKAAEERVKQVGLKIQKSSPSEHIEKNQWKIAYYTMTEELFGGDIHFDAHFLIQDKDGKWISKTGITPEIEVFDKLPSQFHKEYSLVGVYKITNPYVKLDEEKDMEM